MQGSCKVTLGRKRYITFAKGSIGSDKGVSGCERLYSGRIKGIQVYCILLDICVRPWGRRHPHSRMKSNITMGGRGTYLPPFSWYLLPVIMKEERESMIPHRMDKRIRSKITYKTANSTYWHHSKIANRSKITHETTSSIHSDITQETVNSTHSRITYVTVNSTHSKITM